MLTSFVSHGDEFQTQKNKNLDTNSVNILLNTMVFSLPSKFWYQMKTKKYIKLALACFRNLMEGEKKKQNKTKQKSKCIKDIFISQFI